MMLRDHLDAHRVGAMLASALGPDGLLQTQSRQGWVSMLCTSLGLVLSFLLTLALRPGQLDSKGSADKFATEPAGEVEEKTAPHVPCSPARIWAITALNVPYGFAVAALGLMVVPLEAERLWPESHSMALGLLAALAGIAQLVGPQAGYWSDTYRSALGRRRPMLLIGVAMTCTLTCALWFLSLQELRFAYTATFLLQQIALNIILSTQAGLVPDLVPASQQNLAGGCSAANILVGCVAASAYVHMAKEWDYHFTYIAISSLLALVCLVVCGAAQEASSLALPQPSPDEQHSDWLHALADHYTFDRSQYPDFFLLLVTKTLYCASVVVKGFLLFFVQDLFRSLPDARYEDMVGQMAVTAEVSAALTASALILWFSRAPVQSTAKESTSSQNILCLCSGAAWMAIMWFGPVIQGGLAHSQSASMDSQELASIWLPRMLVALGIWGVGQGVYLAGDQALAFELLPDRSQASRFLGFSSVCACIGTVVGGTMAAGLLAFFGAGDPDGYGFPGYAAIFTLASVLSAAISVIGSRINGGILSPATASIS